ITTPVRVSEWVRHAGLAARLAGLLHDLGKYSLKFQEKLRGKAELADAVRHEWISLKLWQAVRSGMDLEDGMG
ncbi:MAG: CRISPR-associated endonuclease Cas3'', partial [Bilophila wadsworthia]